MSANDYRPSLEDVGTHALTRTRNSVGVLTGTFASDTTPDNESVERLITSALGDVARDVGQDIPPSLWDDAKDLVAIRTAALIELTFYGAEIRANLSNYKDLLEWYKNDAAKIVNSIQAQESGASDSNTISGNGAQFSFPVTEGLLDKRM